MKSSGKIVVLSGGVGGAKLVLGLSKVVPANRLVVVANTGDDFEHLGLRICPDLDTLTYTLADLAEPEQGWGRVAETWNFMAAIRQFGLEGWFNLGDADLALHVIRTHMLREGANLTEVTRRICQSLNIQETLMPVTNDPLATIVETTDGDIAFQEYFVRERCEPQVTGFRFAGRSEARLNPDLRQLFVEGRVDVVLLAPSNPFVSIAPILVVDKFQQLLRESPCPVVAVSPIVAGRAIKGPTAKMMSELDMPVSTPAVAQYYRNILDGLIIDEADNEAATEISKLGVKVSVNQTIMRTLSDRVGLAEACLEFSRQLTRKPIL